MLSSCVQLGPGFRFSEEATRAVADARAWSRQFTHAGQCGRVILGPSR
ncbi:MAG: hypothetical protein KF817_07265 [Phycisphaeraceae bacterium]|nr:hypothetical protein [Phycisphaeraceae bacterium]